MEGQEWRVGKLRLRFDLVWSMATSSLRVRAGRSLLTGLTIATSSAFMMYLLTMPRPEDATERESWYLMLALALVVSTAGVLNAMLTSVAQRYREIGTIKCLGGLDSLVLLSVLVESAMLGLGGAAVGAAGGFALSVALAVADHGWGWHGHMALGALPVNVLVVFGVGALLTTLGAAIPAWVAARMPPVEAMRGEK